MIVARRINIYVCFSIYLKYLVCIELEYDISCIVEANDSLRNYGEVNEPLYDIPLLQNVFP